MTRKENFKLGNLHRRQPGSRLEARSRRTVFGQFGLQEPDPVNSGSLTVVLGEEWKAR